MKRQACKVMPMRCRWLLYPATDLTLIEKFFVRSRLTGHIMGRNVFPNRGISPASAFAVSLGPWAD